MTTAGRSMALLLLLSQNALSAELPQYDDTYCLALTAKMLDPTEKMNETNACFRDETAAKAQLIEHWDIISDQSVENCTANSPRAYVYLRFCLAHHVGRQCFRDLLICK